MLIISTKSIATVQVLQHGAAVHLRGLGAGHLHPPVRGDLHGGGGREPRGARRGARQPSHAHHHQPLPPQPRRRRHSHVPR